RSRGSVRFAPPPSDIRSRRFGLRSNRVRLIAEQKQRPNDARIEAWPLPRPRWWAISWIAARVPRAPTPPRRQAPPQILADYLGLPCDPPIWVMQEDTILHPECCAAGFQIGDASDGSCVTSAV